MRTFVRYTFITYIILSSHTLLADSVSISTFPDKVIQGEPIKIVINGASHIEDIQNITFDGKTLSPFLYKGTITTLYGFDINKKAGDFTIKVVMTDGLEIEKVITVLPRRREKAPLGIPEKLGGNTISSQKTLVSTLAQENAVLAGLKTFSRVLWSEKFNYPISEQVVTDSYGYSRQTGDYEIAHKGTDFRAAEGTKVIAANRGIVRLVKNFRNYGKTVVIDHGLGLMTFYMHLSKIHVNQGELVKSGQLIGLSGMTGYADKPHLHLTIRINGISIDPIKFFDIF